ncbi:O-antigen ligase family protein [Hydrogenophaga sp.]|uniref:O-antigen ligase family protein n=1 Tax=Hydrogenophaga sp. TaxID=1904254 RepID=UPI0025C66DC0|nr:O-antigen ligase family protein [Hydrogenophaga sp.]MBT9465980.1 O-antigen ligase family protein [Hydrogenophaga sp.]
MDSLARWSAVALMLGVPTSIALVNIGLFLLLVGWTFSGSFDRKFAVIRANPITLPSLALFGLVLLGVLHTEAPDAVVRSHLYVYSKLPMMLVLLTLFDDVLWRRRAMAAFVIGSVITLVSTYANIWIEVPWSDSHERGFGVTHHVFNDYIAQGLAMSVFVAWCLAQNFAARSRVVQVGFVALTALAVFSITHLLAGRTGQLVVLSMCGVMALVKAPPHWRLPAVLVVMFGGCLLLLSSPLLRERVLQAWMDFNLYSSEGVVSTSIGARLDMWKNAWNMFLDSPLWGQGTGGYRVISSRIYADASQCGVSCIHPHNQYLFFAVEHGLLGLTAYGLLLWALIRGAIRCQGGERAMLAGFSTVLILDGFINGPFWVTTERHLFASMLPLLMASWPAGRRSA